MADQHTVLTRDQFYAYIGQTGQVPQLFSQMNTAYVCKGFRAISSGLFPPGEDVWMWPDGMCLVRKEIFEEMKQALEQISA